MSLLNRVKALEASARLQLENATAIREELEGRSSGSPSRGNKAQDAAAKVLANRRKQIANG